MTKKIKKTKDSETKIHLIFARSDEWLPNSKFSISGEKLLFALDLLDLIWRYMDSPGGKVPWVKNKKEKPQFLLKRVRKIVEKHFPHLLEPGTARRLYSGKFPQDHGFDSFHYILRRTPSLREVTFEFDIVLHACIAWEVHHLQTFDGPIGDYRKPLDEFFTLVHSIAVGELTQEMVAK